ncbi:MAG: AraC family transcriptional regulator [Kangiellaceae bacterium]|nr:AraC family transcriptional regulator [Kangiellaceae bacterium]MCW8998138.1 AraC family transcriptional regulator [Kangiellaceae bacterium]MCW9016496.1 AraC family transcriptional regulator [Kangiellaceae bacterium]
MADESAVAMVQERRLKAVEKYIEDNLDQPLSLERLSNIACYSTFHFHRLFSSFLGESVYSYRKRLLLERSVRQLRYSEQSITEIALNAGYDNQASYNKAFKKLFGVTPSICRKQKLSLVSNPIKPNFEEIEIMEAEICQLKTIHVASARARGKYAQAAEEAWGQIMKFAYSNKLMKAETETFGICHDDPSVTEPENIRYDACISVNDKVELEKNIYSDVIEGGMYAIFLHKGSYENLSQTYSAIFHQWLPQSNFELRELPPFEKYLNRDPRRTKPENLRTEIYVPITKR